MNDNELNEMVSNLSEIIISTSELAVSGRENEMYLHHKLLMKACIVLFNCRRE
jgi:hypothetical protein